MIQHVALLKYCFLPKLHEPLLLRGVSFCDNKFLIHSIFFLKYYSNWEVPCFYLSCWKGLSDAALPPFYINRSRARSVYAHIMHRGPHPFSIKRYGYENLEIIDNGAGLLSTIYDSIYNILKYANRNYKGPEKQEINNMEKWIMIFLCIFNHTFHHPISQYKH